MNHFFPLRFFIDVNQPIAFEVAFFSMSFAILVIIISNAFIDGLYFTLGLCLSSHFEILRDRVAKSQTQNELKELVDYHIKIISKCKEFSRVFAIILVGNHSYYAAVIAFIGFQLASVSS
jgi:hypothetical protein